MSQLDKTFPTLDCSACIMTPKMVDVARHPNIELMTYAEPLSLEGKARAFRARVLKKARYVDLTTCTGCGDCAKVCPVIVPNKFDMELAEEVAKMAQQARAMLLANHGPVVAAAGLDEAVDATEELEETARLYLMLRGLPTRFLTAAQVADLNARFPN